MLSLFSVCLFSVCSLWVKFFLILLQYYIRPLSPNCDMFASEFAAEVNLRRHDTLPEPNCDVCALKFAARVNLKRHDTST